MALYEADVLGCLRRYVHPDEQLKNWSLGIRRPSTALNILAVALACFGLLPGIIALIILRQSTKTYILGLTDRRLIALRFRGNLKLDQIMEYSLDGFPMVRTSMGNPAKIKIFDPLRPFEAVFPESRHGLIYNGHHARAIAADLAARSANVAWRGQWASRGLQPPPQQSEPMAREASTAGGAVQGAEPWQQPPQSTTNPLPTAPFYPQAQPPAYSAPPPVWAYQQRAPLARPSVPSRNYADVGNRLGAAVLDALLEIGAMVPGFVMMMVGGAMAGPNPDPSRPTPAADAVIGVGLALFFAGALAVWLYNVYLLGRDGASLGKRWMKIKVTDAGNRLGFGKALLREICKRLIGSVCFILLLWPLWDREKQGLYDKIVGTHVV